MAAMSPLRRRMTEDMTVRNLSPATQALSTVDRDRNWWRTSGTCPSIAAIYTLKNRRSLR